jgi:hypothetical protein
MYDYYAKYAAMRYAILCKESGDLYTKCEDPNDPQVKRMLEHSPELEVVDTKHTSHLFIHYAEMGGPNGYGYEEPAFETYGSLNDCIRRMLKWMQKEVTFWGPDPRDVRDYFRHCSLTINGKDYTKRWLIEVDKINMKTLYI